MRVFDPKKIPKPKDFYQLNFDNSKPLDIEIGCGVGYHPIRYAQAHPERQILAIERTEEKFAKFSGRLKNHKSIPNLFPIHGDAIAWIAHGISPASVDRYFILYPNPYPKKSHKNLRFPFMPFFSYLVDTIKPDGELVLATNEEFYYKETKAELVAGARLKLTEDKVLPADFTPRTHFEKKYLARGETCWNLVFRKK